MYRFYHAEIYILQCMFVCGTQNERGYYYVQVPADCCLSIDSGLAPFAKRHLSGKTTAEDFSQAGKADHSGQACRAVV